MGVFLQLLGGGWAVIGIANILLSDLVRSGSDEDFFALLMFNMPDFILPGFTMYGVGYLIMRNSELWKQADRDTDTEEITGRPEMIPISEYAGKTGMSEEYIINSIREGRLIGRLVEGKWMVQPK